jgi:mRNA interferase RelE/StbE
LPIEPWRVVVAPPARRDLLRLPEKAAAAVLETLDAIATNPRRVGKPLQFELEGRWSARRGPYRVIYRLDEDNRTVIVLAIGA